MTADVPREIGQLALVPIDQVLVESNVRADLGDLDELAASIKAVGLLEPIVVHVSHSLGPRDLYAVDHGHRRLAACALAGMTDIPAIIREEPAGIDRPIDQLVDNMQRADLNPLEEAAAFRAILDADPALTQKALADRIGRSAPYVSNALRLLDLGAEVRAMAETGQITGAHAKALAGLKGKPQLEYAQRAYRERMSSHELEDRIAQDRKWQERQQAQEEQTAASKAANIERAVAELAKKKVPTDARIIVRKAYYGSGLAAPAIKAIKAAGYAKVEEGTAAKRSEALDCDCTAWLVDVYYNPPQVLPACTSQAHTRAKMDADRARQSEQWTRQERVRERLGVCLAADAERTTRLTARVALWCVLGWQVKDWAAKRPAPAGENGKPVKRTPWQTLVSLSDEELGTELAKALAQQFHDHAEIKVDWEALEAELAPPPEPISPAEAAEHVAVKRAARRAEKET